MLKCRNIYLITFVVINLDMKKPLILVTNDDGITAPGLRSLITVMNKIGEVVVDGAKSAGQKIGKAAGRKAAKFTH